MKIKPEAKRAHARFSPSAAHRWMHCGASITFIEDNKIPNVSSSYADEGTVAHTILEICLKQNKAPDSFKGKTINGIKVDAEMVAAVELTVDTVREIAAGEPILVEGDVPIAVIGDDGHPDAIIYDKDTAELHVIDFKYGKGHAVEVANNEQMMLYALGALELPLRTAHGRIWQKTSRVTLHIIQPRAPHDDGPHRQWSTNVVRLHAYEHKVAGQIGDIKARKAKFAPSTDACRFCPAKGQCPALANEAVKAANNDFADFLDEPEAVPAVVKKAKAEYPNTVKAFSDKQLGSVMDRLALLFLWANAVELEVARRIAAKRTVPNWKMVEGKSNRRWRDAKATLAALLKLGLKLDDVAPRELAGITTIEATLPEKKREAFMAKHTEKPAGKPTLAVASDKRAPINYTTAADDFAAHIDAEE